MVFSQQIHTKVMLALIFTPFFVGPTFVKSIFEFSLKHDTFP